MFCDKNPQFIELETEIKTIDLLFVHKPLLESNVPYMVMIMKYLKVVDVNVYQNYIFFIVSKTSSELFNKSVLQYEHVGTI